MSGKLKFARATRHFPVAKAHGAESGRLPPGRVGGALRTFRCHRTMPEVGPEESRMKRATLLAAAILLAALLGCAVRTGPKSGAGPLPIGENSRTSDPRIENRRWELIELNGRQIEPPSDRAGAYLRLDATESR